MNITLTPELEKLVEERLRRGDYEDADTLVREALHRLIEEDESELQAAKAAIDEGLAQSRRGEGRPSEEVFKDMRSRHGLPR